MNVAALLEPAPSAAGGPERNNKRLRGARDGVPPCTPGDAGTGARSCAPAVGSWGGPRCVGRVPAPQSSALSTGRGGNGDAAQHPGHGTAAPAAKPGSAGARKAPGLAAPPSWPCHRGEEGALPPAFTGPTPPSPS